MSLGKTHSWLLNRWIQNPASSYIGDCRHLSLVSYQGGAVNRGHPGLPVRMYPMAHRFPLGPLIPKDFRVTVTAGFVLTCHPIEQSKITLTIPWLCNSLSMEKEQNGTCLSVSQENQNGCPWTTSSSQLLARTRGEKVQTELELQVGTEEVHYESQWVKIQGGHGSITDTH